MFTQVAQISFTKYKVADNIIRGMRRHLFFHLFLFLVIAAMLLLSGTVFFWLMFNFLMEQEVFGPQLMDSMLGMMMAVFFSMLVFSNLIITLTTTYISREIEYLFSLPLPPRVIFMVKLIESVFYSSWAFVLLSFPLIASFGIARKADALFYLFSLLLIVPFLLIPSAIGAIFTMLLAALMPARKMRAMSVVLMGLVFIISVIVFRYMGGSQLLLVSGELNFNKIQSFLNMGNLPVLPSYWLSEGIVAASNGQWRDALYWLAQLWANALMVTLVAIWLVPPLYYRGWCLARESVAETMLWHGRTIFDRLEVCYQFLSRPIRAIVTKDLKTFWRDPAQWSQFVILFGLLVIYIFSVRGAYSANLREVEKILPEWKTLVSFFNLGATCTILSIFTSRFFYPMLSLEGKQYWTIGLAPLPRTRLVWEKFWLCWLFAFVAAETLMIFSGMILRVEPVKFWLSIATVFIMSLGLSSLSIGLGAITPNFNEDNPARIANGLGGTLNIIFSIGYIAIVIGLLYPIVRHVVDLQNVFFERFPVLFYLALTLFVVVNCGVIVLPMLFGLRRWNAMEF